jgi:hypothetical protein
LENLKDAMLPIWQLRIKNIATVGPHALNPSPLLVRAGFELATNMAALSSAEMQQALDAWPVDLDALPASVRAACDLWARLRLPAIDLAIRNLDANPNRGFTAPGGRFPKSHKHWALTVHGTATAGGGPTPSPSDLRSLLPTTPDVVSDKLRSLEAQLLQQSSTIASLLRQQAAIIWGSKPTLKCTYMSHFLTFLQKCHKGTLITLKCWKITFKKHL